jgi:hypothetical protein
MTQTLQTEELPVPHPHFEVGTTMRSTVTSGTLPPARERALNRVFQHPLEGMLMRVYGATGTMEAIYERLKQQSSPQSHGEHREM